MCCGYSSRAGCLVPVFSRSALANPGMFTFFQLLQKEWASNHSLIQQSRTIVFKTFCKYHNNLEQKYLKAAIVQYIYFPRRFVWKYCVSAAVSQTTHDLVGVKYWCLAERVLKNNGGFWIFCYFLFSTTVTNINLLLRLPVFFPGCRRLLSNLSSLIMWQKY